MDLMPGVDQGLSFLGSDDLSGFGALSFTDLMLRCSDVPHHIESDKPAEEGQGHIWDFTTLSADDEKSESDEESYSSFGTPDRHLQAGYGTGLTPEALENRSEQDQILDNLIQSYNQGGNSDILADQGTGQHTEDRLTDCASRSDSDFSLSTPPNSVPDLTCSRAGDQSASVRTEQDLILDEHIRSYTQQEKDDAQGRRVVKPCTRQNEMNTHVSATASATKPRKKRLLASSQTPCCSVPGAQRLSLWQFV